MVCEFTRIYSIKSLTEALEVIRKVDRPNAGILVDNLHLARCNLEPSDLLDVDPKLLPYVQLSDSSAQPRGDLLFDARNDRCNPGEGELPIQDFLNSIPTYTPLSLEIRSAPLREKFKDPVKRAQEVLKATKRVLNQD